MDGLYVGRITKMDLTIIKLILALVPVAGAILVPLLLSRKSSRYYSILWSIYVVAALAVFLSALWSMLNQEPPRDPQGGFPMSPIGNASLGRLVHAVGFLVSIPVLLYLLTLGLPWVFKGWPRGAKPNGEQAGTGQPATRPWLSRRVATNLNLNRRGASGSRVARPRRWPKGVTP